MDIVYTSLDRRPAVDQAPVGEVAEVIDALWAHATPDDRLEHASGRPEPDRIDLLLFLRTPDDPDPDGAQRRAAALVYRSHLASPLLQRRYLPPPPAPASSQAHGTRRAT
ncbi:hypothetical protein ABIA33_003967 [Streptacidiphilus sp. MAP12-16]|uniref:hypothetical protein n=1 Tax=Streptacidiphilus sp. MAP12-16 TaxID=3156300 RepID=UPI003519BD65